MCMAQIDALIRMLGQTSSGARTASAEPPSWKVILWLTNMQIIVP